MPRDTKHIPLRDPATGQFIRQLLAAQSPQNTANERRIAHIMRVFSGAGGTALYVALAGWAYTAATVGDMIFAYCLLVLAFAFAVIALLLSEKYGAFANREKVTLNLSSITIFLLSLLG
jgi:hypothetical protein